MRPRTLSLFLGTLLVAVLLAPSALAEEAPDPFCRDHWFAMGSCRDRRWAGPELMLGVDLGASVMEEHGPFGFGNGVGSVMNPGPAWGVRVGVELLPWIALEAHYLGMYNSAQPVVSTGSSGGFFTSGVVAVLRLTAPLPYVHPYIFGGGGYYDVALIGASGSELHSSSQCGIPMGFGLDVPLTYHLSLGGEATYHYQFQESFSDVTTNGIDGGDFSTFNLVLRARL
jgi:hypothetical protein